MPLIVAFFTVRRDVDMKAKYMSAWVEQPRLKCDRAARHARAWRQCNRSAQQTAILGENLDRGRSRVQPTPGANHERDEYGIALRYLRAQRHVEQRSIGHRVSRQHYGTNSVREAGRQG